MSIATDLQGVYTNLNTELTAINTALADKGQTAASTIHDVGAKIGSMTIGNPKWTSLIEGGITELTEDDFYGMTKIRQYAFYGNKTLRSVNIPGNIIEIGSRDSQYGPYNGESFGDTNITTLILGEGIKYIRYGSFMFCQMLTSVTIPASVVSIGMYAFNIGGLALNAEITMLGETPPSIDIYAFSEPTHYDAAVKKIIVPYSSDHSVLAAYQNATNWAAYASILEEAPAPTEEV